MAEKKSKVTKYEFIKEWTGTYGTSYTFLVGFENGDSGQVNFKSKDDKYFQMGKMVDYVIEQVPRKNDPLVKDKKISKPKTGNPFGGGGVSPKGIKEYKAEAVLVAAKIAYNASIMKEGVTFDKVYPVVEKKLFDRLTEIFK